MTELSIIIVNYKTPELVIGCLETVFAYTKNLEFEAYVVDNHSGDGSREVVLGRYPSVKWIQMEYNAGFARANNVAIRQAAGGVLLLLNSDTLLEDGAIERCYREFVASSYVACGVQLLNADHTPQISGNFFMRGGLNNLLPLPYLGKLFKKAGYLFKVAKPNVSVASALVEVDWINGAYLMVKRSAIDKAGLLDEDFFLYFEEAEWCSRLRRHGKLCIYGQFRVIHLQGASANETFGSEGKGYYNLYDRKGWQIMLSGFVRIRKQYGVVWFLLQLSIYILEIPVFGIGVLLSGVASKKRARYSGAQFRQYVGNIGRLIAKTPAILRNKPYFYKVL